MVVLKIVAQVYMIVQLILQASNDSGKGGSVHENANASPPDEDRIFEFNIPTDMCGLFIGTRGKTIKMISQQSGTKIRLQNNPYTRDFQICVIEGKYQFNQIFPKKLCCQRYMYSYRRTPKNSTSVNIEDW